MAVGAFATLTGSFKLQMWTSCIKAVFKVNITDFKISSHADKMEGNLNKRSRWNNVKKTRSNRDLSNINPVWNKQEFNLDT
jgi:hypothetical protein